MAIFCSLFHGNLLFMFLFYYSYLLANQTPDMKCGRRMGFGRWSLKTCLFSLKSPRNFEADIQQKSSLLYKQLGIVHAKLSQVCGPKGTFWGHADQSLAPHGATTKLDKIMGLPSWVFLKPAWMEMPQPLWMACSSVTHVSSRKCYLNRKCLMLL